MKYFKIILILLLVNFVFCKVSFCQNPMYNSRNNTNDTKNTKDTSAKQSLVNKILQALADSLNKPKVIPTEKKARIAYEFKQERLYPSDDAIELVHILNPWLDTVQSEIPAQRIVRMPAFPWITHEQRKGLRENRRTASKPDAQTNGRFDSLVNVFDETFPAFVDGYKNFVSNKKSRYSTGLRSFYDTLLIFRNRILPALKIKLPELCKAKVEYLNNNLSELVNTMQRSTAVNENSIFYAFYIIDDFFATADFSNTRENAFLQNAGNTFIFSNAVYITTGSNDLVQEVKFPADNSIDTKVIKCHLYVYDQQASQIKKRFQVFLAPYITTFNLENCRDTIEYIKSKSATWDAGLACTGTAPLCNNSNWAVYCRDLQSGRTYLINQEYNYQNIVDRDDNDNSFFKICIIYRGN